MSDDLHTLTAPYALDALTSDERERFDKAFTDVVAELAMI